MSIGFIVPNVTNSKVIPDKTLSKNSTPKVRVATFGGGYQQRIADGANSLAETFDLNFTNRSKTEADDIIAFLESKKGVTSFAFTYPDSNSTTTYINTGTTPGSGASSLITMGVSANNLNISQGATVSGTGHAASKVLSISGENALNLVLNTSQDLGSVALTFTNSGEKQIKVICSDWSINYSNTLYYNVNTTFNRVYEP